jgi:SseB protein N-terminal domain
MPTNSPKKRPGSSQPRRSASGHLAPLPPSKLPPEQRLDAALERQDAAAVAFALRNDHVIVPLLVVDGPAQVRVFRRGEADKYMLLLFSSPQTYIAMVPEEPEHRVLPYDRATLTDFLEQNIGVLEGIWFDVAGPHAMQADPHDVLEALRVEASALDAE